MDQRHRHSTLSHRGGTPLDRATTRVASCEYARQARLLEERLPRTFLPGVLIERRTVKRLPCQDEAPFVEVDGTFQPTGVGISPDEGKERPDSEVPSYTRAVVLDYGPLQAVLSHEFSDLCAGEQLDVLGGRDPVDEILRHALAQVASPYEQVNPPCASGQEHCRLARRVAPAYDRDLLALAPLSLSLRRSVVDAHALETPEAGHVEPAVARPGCDDHAAGRDLTAFGELYMVVAVFPPQTDSLPGHCGAGAELVGLDQDAAGQLEAGEACGKARVVLYARRGTCLPPKGHRLEGEGGEALRGYVDLRAEARRTGTHHDEVVGSFQGGIYFEACSAGELKVRRVLEHILSLPDGHRRLRGLRTEPLEQGFGLGVLLELDPDVGHPVAGRDLSKARRFARVARAYDSQTQAGPHHVRAPGQEGL